MRERRGKYGAVLIPIAFVLVLWIIHFVAFETGVNLTSYGLYPRKIDGLTGIFTIPFIHGSWEHLINNSIPLLVLGWALFHFYPTLAWKTLFWIWIISGIWLWISGRSSFHIGASGIVYGLAAFLFLSGWLRKEKRVASLSLLIAFLYGSMWWGVLPVDPKISWEGHLWGALAGFALAWVYRKQGPWREPYRWEKQPTDEELERIALGKTDESDETTSDPQPRKIVYVYRESPKTDHGDPTSN